MIEKDPDIVDIQPPKESRCQKLTAASNSNAAAGRPLFADVAIASAGELLWILVSQDWVGGLGEPVTAAADWFLQARNNRLTGGSSSSLAPADLRGIDLSDVNIENLDLHMADMRDARLSRCSLVGTNLDGTLISSSEVFDALRLIPDNRSNEIREILERNQRALQPACRGVVLATRNELLWLIRELKSLYSSTQEPSRGTDLAGANLSDVDLSGFDLRDLNLSQVRFVSEEREHALADHVLMNREQGKYPYHGISVERFNEIMWILQRQNVATAVAYVDLRGAIFKLQSLARISLGHARLQRVRLSKKDLREADLTKCSLVGADLSDSILDGAVMVGADMRRSRLDNASLRGSVLTIANLSHAILVQANLEAADLRATNLSGTDLELAKLQDTDLRGARLDSDSSLRDLTLDSHTKLGNVRWSEVQLSAVKWSLMSRLGDETEIMEARTRAERILAFRRTIQAYTGLTTALVAQGLELDASRYRLRSLRLQRHLMRLKHNYFAWLLSAMLDITTSFGTRLRRLAFTYLYVVAGFAAGYWLIATSHPTLLPQARNLFDALLLSATVFYGKGFTADIATSNRVVNAVAVGESIIGVFLVAMFVAALTRRLYGPITT